MLTETETPIQMRLYASGNNAWNQLVFSSPLSRAGDGTDSATDEPEDWNSFALMLGPESRLELVTAQVSYTLVLKESQLFLAGLPSAGPPSSPDLTPLAAVHDDGQYYNLFHSARAPISLADICAPHSAALSHRLVRQIEAYDAGIVVLLDDASVWVYGDSRYPDCLSNPDEASPESNHRVTGSKTRVLQHVSSLDDLPTGPITKVSAGGYTLAALTEGGDVYVWGGRPSHKSPIEDILGEPSPLDVDFDVADIALGKQHIIVLTTDGLVFGKGCNRSGQLGCATDSKQSDGHWVSEWAQLQVNTKSDEVASKVYAAPYASFVLAKSGQV